MWTGVINFQSDGKFEPAPKIVRLTVLGLRSPCFATVQANTFLFGLLRDGCPFLHRTAAENGTALLWLDEPAVGANGYYLDISSSIKRSAFDPVRWIVHALKANFSNGDASGVSNESDWTVIGASIWQGIGAEASFYPDLAYPTPLAASNGSVVRVMVDGRPEWEWFVQYVGVYIVASIGWTAFVIGGRQRQQGVVAYTLVPIYACNTALRVAAGTALIIASSDWRNIVATWIWVFVDGMTALMLSWNEALAMYTLFIYGVSNIVGLVSIYSTAMPLPMQ